MNTSIVYAALSTVNVSENLATLVKIIESHINPETAILMLLGKYEEPKVAEHVDASVYDEKDKGTIAHLISFNPLAHENSQVSYTYDRYEKRYFKSENERDRWLKGYGADCNKEESEQYCVVGERTILINNTTSVVHWNKYMIQ